MDDMLNDLVAAETTVWEALVAGDARAYRAALSEDFQGVYPDGFVGREAQLACLVPGPTVALFTLSEARLRVIEARHALLSYKAQFVRAGGTDEEVMYVSSLWRRDAEGWVNLFSQDTPEGRPVP